MWNAYFLEQCSTRRNCGRSSMHCCKEICTVQSGMWEVYNANWWRTVDVLCQHTLGQCRLPLVQTASTRSMNCRTCPAKQWHASAGCVAFHLVHADVFLFHVQRTHQLPKPNVAPHLGPDSPPRQCHTSFLLVAARRTSPFHLTSRSRPARRQQRRRFRCRLLLLPLSFCCSILPLPLCFCCSILPLPLCFC